MKLVPGLLVFSLFFFRFSVRLPQGSHQGANASGDSEAETDDGQPPSRSQLPVEPTSAEQADEDAEREVETNRRVAADSFPALVHQH